MLGFFPFLIDGALYSSWIILHADKFDAWGNESGLYLLLIVSKIEISHDDDNSFSLTVIMYVPLPMPLLFFVGSDSSTLLTESDSG